MRFTAQPYLLRPVVYTMLLYPHYDQNIICYNLKQERCDILGRFGKGESTVASMKVSIKAAAQELGVREETLRRWEQAGKITSERSARGHRRYDLATLRFVEDNRERRSLEPEPHARATIGKEVADEIGRQDRA